MKAVRAAWWVWALVPFLVVSCVLLAGCAGPVERKAEPMKGVCIFKPIGQTDEGYAVVAYHCEPK